MGDARISMLIINSACESCCKYRMSIQNESDPGLSYNVVLCGGLFQSEVANRNLSLKINFHQMLYHPHKVIYLM